MPDPQDLLTTGALTSYLSAGGMTLSAAQVSAAPALITAASKEVCRECRRYFALTAYDEVLTPTPGAPEKGLPDLLDLSCLPVQSVARVSAGRTTALFVSNNATTPNQVARAQFAWTGDPEITLTRTGLALTTVGSGVQVVTPVAWTTASPFTTVAAVAALINATGNGWAAVVQGPFGPWAAAELYGTPAPYPALGSPGAAFDVFSQDVAAEVDLRAGTVYLPRLGSTAGAQQPWPDPVAGPSGWLQLVRVTYTGGWAVIPEPIQRATAELVKAGMERLATDTTLQTETGLDYSYAVRAGWEAVPAWVQQTLAKYRVMR